MAATAHMKALGMSRCQPSHGSISSHKTMIRMAALTALGMGNVVSIFLHITRRGVNDTP
jgi:hypothetical protein